MANLAFQHAAFAMIEWEGMLGQQRRGPGLRVVAGLALGSE